MATSSINLAKSIHHTLFDAIAVAEQAIVGVSDQDGRSHYLSMLLEDRLGRLHHQLVALFRIQDQSTESTHASRVESLARRRRRLIGDVDRATDVAADTDSSGAVRRSILGDLEGIERDFADYEVEFARVYCEDVEVASGFTSASPRTDRSGDLSSS